MSEYWIVVGNSSHITLYASGSDLREFTELCKLEHPESRLHNNEIDSDSQGWNRHGPSGVPVSFSPEQTPHEHQVEVFALEVADLLRQGRVAGGYDKLILVASPKFLGAMRKHLDDDTARMVFVSIHHDWSTQRPEVLAASVRGALAA
jgi:protein required for attachment to host cells